MKELTLHIQGMSCGHCLNAVNTALAGLPGLQLGSVQMGRAQLQYDPGVTSPEQIAAAVREAGYETVPSGGTPTEVSGSAPN